MSRSKNCCLFPALSAQNANSVAISLCTMQRSLFLFQFFLMICSLNYLADVHLFSANLFFCRTLHRYFKYSGHEWKRGTVPAENRCFPKVWMVHYKDRLMYQWTAHVIKGLMLAQQDVFLLFSPPSSLHPTAKYLNLENKTTIVPSHIIIIIFLAVLGVPKESRTSRSIVSVSPVNLHVYTCESCFESIIYKMSILPISEWCLLDPFKAKCHFVSGNFSKQLWGMTPSSPPPTSYTNTHRFPLHT